MVACSETHRREYLRRKLVEAERIVTIYNGVSPMAPARDPHELRTELGLPLHAPVVLSVGRFTDQKGFDVLLEAIPRVHARCPDARLVLVGDGVLHADLQRRAEELGIGDLVYFAGMRRDVADFMQLASVIAVPSRYESFPLVVLEAMMAERPVVASNIEVLAEALDDGRTGVLVPLEAERLGDAVLELLCDPERSTRLGTAAGKVARSRFGLERMAQDYQAAYRSVLERAA
jgi:glycosyltransferase involved in cell wall biosynthesis